MDIPAPPGVYTCLETVIHSAFLTVFDELPLKKIEIHNKFDKLWKDLAIKENTNQTKEYWAGIKTARRVINNLYWLFRYFTVVRPFQTCHVTIAGQDIQCSYAVIERQSKRGVPYICILREHKPLIFKYPDPVDLICWFSAVQDYPNIGIINFPLLRGELWKFGNLDYNIVEQYITGMVNASKHVYPSPGSHCNTCVSKKCLEVIDKWIEPSSLISKLESLDIF
jgi:hypothetical protein